METNTERANHGPKSNRATRVSHQMRQCGRRDIRRTDTEELRTAMRKLRGRYPQATTASLYAKACLEVAA